MNPYTPPTSVADRDHAPPRLSRNECPICDTTLPQHSWLTCSCCCNCCHARLAFACSSRVRSMAAVPGIVVSVGFGYMTFYSLTTDVQYVVSQPFLYFVLLLLMPLLTMATLVMNCLWGYPTPTRRWRLCSRTESQQQRIAYRVSATDASITSNGRCAAPPAVDHTRSSAVG